MGNANPARVRGLARFWVPVKRPSKGAHLALTSAGAAKNQYTLPSADVFDVVRQRVGMHLAVVEADVAGAARANFYSDPNLPRSSRPESWRSSRRPERAVPNKMVGRPEAGARASRRSPHQLPRNRRAGSAGESSVVFTPTPNSAHQTPTPNSNRPQTPNPKLPKLQTRYSTYSTRCPYTTRGLSLLRA